MNADNEYPRTNLLKPALMWVWKRWVSIAPVVLMAVLLVQAGFALGLETAPFLGPDGKGTLALTMLAVMGFIALLAVLSGHPAKPEEKGGTEDATHMQALIDRAYREGFRVWSVLPEAQSVEQYLYLARLRSAGFVVSDRAGRIDAIEVGETPAQCRRLFRVVETVPAWPAGQQP